MSNEPGEHLRAVSLVATGIALLVVLAVYLDSQIVGVSLDLQVGGTASMSVPIGAVVFATALGGLCA